MNKGIPTFNPFPGLRPFEQHESHLFFGRDGQSDELLRRLRCTRFLAVVGTSGSGKSSLMRAGLLPALHGGLMAETGSRWRIALLRPGADPLDSLAAALHKVELFKSDEALADYGTSILRAILSRSSLGLIEAVKQARLRPHENLLVVVDQFEELFTYEEEAHKAGKGEEAPHFVQLLLEATRQRDLPIYVVLTMRSDYLGDCAQFRDLPEAINDGQYLIPRMTREQRRSAITGPIAVAQGEISDQLVNRLLNDVGDDPDQLPILQHALMRSWDYWQAHQQDSESLDLHHYLSEEIGGMQNALSRHADEAYAELAQGVSEAEGMRKQWIAEKMFKFLTEKGKDNREIRRPGKLRDIAAIANASEAEVIAVIEVFRRFGRSFLVLKLLAADTFIDISHESLIRQWQRLKDWVKQEARSAETYGHLQRSARRWKSKEAALWGTPDLEIALAWKEREKPTPEWAERYGGDFHWAMEFLDASEQKHKEDEAAKEAARQLELKRVRKQRTLMVVALVIVGIFALWAFRERNHAKTMEKERTHNLFESKLTDASFLARNEDYAAAREVLTQTYTLDQDMPAERRHTRNLVAWFVDLMGGLVSKTYTVPNASLRRVALSPDSRLLAAVGEKGTVALIDTDGGLVKNLPRHTEEVVYGVVFHPQGQWLATADVDSSIIIWSLPEGKEIQNWSAPGKVYALAISSNGTLLASGGNDKNVTLWDVKKGRAVKTLRGHSKLIIDLAFSPDGLLLASASYDSTIRVWNLQKGTISHILRGHTDAVEGVAFHPNSQILATSSSDHSIRLWDVASGSTIRMLSGHRDQVYGLAFMDSGNRLVSASRDLTIRVWDTKSGVTLMVLKGHTAAVVRVATDGARLFSSSNDGTVRRWDIGRAESQMSMQVVDMRDELASCAIAPNCSTVAVGFANGALRLYTLPEVDSLWEQANKHTDKIRRFAFSPNSEYLASASYDRSVMLWQTGKGRLLQTFSDHGDRVYAVTFSPDGKSLASASGDGTIGLFELGKEKGRFHPAHKSAVTSVTFDASGQHLLSTGDDGQTKLWDLSAWPPKPLPSFLKSQYEVSWAAFSPDDSLVASVGTTGEYVRIFYRGAVQELYGHENTVFRVAFSPDGGQLATVSGDATVRMWDLTAKKELFTLRLPTFSGRRGPLWDFDFRCAPPESGGECWIAVPLVEGKLVLYRLGKIYD